MFTRIVSMTCKPGQVQQACKTITDNVLPILKKQKGFLDEILLVSTTDPNQLLGMSFWNSREDAEAWNREQYQKVRQQVMQEVLASEPILQTYDVNVSTAHRINAGKAA